MPSSVQLKLSPNQLGLLIQSTVAQVGSFVELEHREKASWLGILFIATGSLNKNDYGRISSGNKSVGKLSSAFP